MTTVTPIIIDRVAYPSLVEPQNQTFGPWVYGGKLYVMLAPQFQNSPEFTSFVRVYSRAYNASENVPWLEKDAAHHPKLSGFELGVWQDGDGIYAVFNGYIEEAATVVFRRFDLSTETWGPVISSFVDTTIEGWVHLRSVGADWLIYYNESPTGSAYVRKYTGSWASPIAVSTNIVGGADALQITEGNDGLFHLLWRQAGSFTASFRTYSRTFEPVTETLGPIAQVTDLHNVVFPNPGVVWDDKVVIGTAHINRSTFPASSIITVAYGSPTEEPSWIEEMIVNDEFKWGQWTVVGEDGDLYAWWVTANALKFSRRSPGGWWSTPEVWYDYNGRNFYDDDGVTLVPWPTNNIFQSGSISQINGAWNILLGAFIDDKATVVYFHGFGGEVSNVYTDEAQDLTVMAE